MRPSFESSFERRAENVLRQRRCQVGPIDTRDAHVYPCVGPLPEVLNL
jgi:hypothetical protein